MIKAVIFDLGRVIIPFDFGRAYAGFEALSGIPADEVSRRIAQTDLFARFETGQLSPDLFVEAISSLLGFRTTFEEFSQIWTSIFLAETLIPESLLEGLARRYRLVLLSNTNVIHFEMVKANYPLLKHFHARVLSFEVGAMKPSPLIFQKAIEEAECKPEECFFTDDIQLYVEAARQQGIHAIQFEASGQIQAELRRLGVVWDA